MRISNAMIADNIKSYLSMHTERLVKTQEQIASGKRINRASDDPIGMSRALGYRKTIASLEQYNANITDAKFHVETVEDILGGITDLLRDAKAIASDPKPDGRAEMADMVVAIREQVLQMANSRVNGNYVFAGDRTDVKPFDGTAYQGDNGTKDYMIGEGLFVNFEADGEQIFGNVFDVLNDLEDGLRNESNADITAQLPLIEDIIAGIATVRAGNAGKYKRLEATENFNSRFTVNTESLLSRTEDTDIAAAAIDLKIQETAYQSTLATAAKIVQPSLIDYLK
ncbi:MAG: hypothetical protein VR64_17020 [Desulfatitalea sp. BRH_c12]|nr:MAG: hypothetical protein VR64_17020 [Desulfatitalea sp. BRH_c12]